MLTVAMATRLNNFRSSRFKTPVLPADFLFVCVCVCVSASILWTSLGLGAMNCRPAERSHVCDTSHDEEKPSLYWFLSQFGKQT